MIAAAVAAEGLSPGGIPPSSVFWTAVFVALAAVVLRARGTYDRRLRRHPLDEIRTVVTGTALAAMGVLSLRVVATDDPAMAGQTVRAWAFAASFLVLARVVLACVGGYAGQAGARGAPTLIIGAGQVGQRTAERLFEAPHLGLRPIGFLDKEPLVEMNGGSKVPVLGASWDLERVVEAHRVEHAIVTFSTAPHDVLLRIVRRCHELGVAVSFVPRLFEEIKEHVTVEHLGGLPLVSVRRTNPKGWQFGVKYAIDRVAAAFLLVLISPIFAATAVAVWVSLGRPIFYRQRRVGCDGQEFQMLKFRSMKSALAPEIFPVLELLPGKAPGGVEVDDRRTRIGRFIRRTSIDELPQLVNVLRGEMSIVGPRPERPEFVEIFERDVHRYADRHRVRSGITGWAQVNGLRGKTSLADRIEWDNYYIDNWSLWFDLKIVLATGLALVRFPAE